MGGQVRAITQGRAITIQFDVDRRFYMDWPLRAEVAPGSGRLKAASLSDK